MVTVPLLLACNTSPGFGSLGGASSPAHTYTVYGLAFDGMPEPARPGGGFEPPVHSAIEAAATADAIPLGEPGQQVTPSVAAVEAAALSVPDLIASYDWPVDEALRIATCESGLQPWAENGRFKGLFQLDTANGGWFAYYGYDVSAWADPAVNVAVAHLLWQDEGWAPWSCA